MAHWHVTPLAWEQPQRESGGREVASLPAVTGAAVPRQEERAQRCCGPRGGGRPAQALAA